MIPVFAQATNKSPNEFVQPLPLSGPDFYLVHTLVYDLSKTEHTTLSVAQPDSLFIWLSGELVMRLWKSRRFLNSLSRNVF